MMTLLLQPLREEWRQRWEAGGWNRTTHASSGVESVWSRPPESLGLEGIDRKKGGNIIFVKSMKGVETQLSRG